MNASEPRQYELSSLFQNDNAEFYNFLEEMKCIQYKIRNMTWKDQLCYTAGTALTKSTEESLHGPIQRIPARPLSKG